MRRPFSLLLLVFFSFTIFHAFAQEPFLTQDEWVKLRDESNGALAYENLRYLTTLHRVPATPQFDQAAAFMEKKAREYGLSNVTSEKFPIDGKITYGLMRSYLAWNVESGMLTEIKSPGERVIGDWAKEPIRLADYSRSAEIETTLVDVGDGTKDSDYAGKDLKGKIVLADGFLMGVERLAIAKYGAAGIVSDMPNQRTAWSGLDKTLVRWGHLDARQPEGFAFMVSKAEAEELRAELKQGEVKLRARVKATVGTSGCEAARRICFHGFKGRGGGAARGAEAGRSEIARQGEGNGGAGALDGGERNDSWRRPKRGRDCV